MSRRQSRSLSPRSPDSGRPKELPNSADPIGESDYFLKSAEFRKWLKDEKDRYFDELTGEKARSYFRKFVKAWNRGKLRQTYYEGIEPAALSASSLTAYKWSFASKLSRAEQDAISEATRGTDTTTSLATKSQVGKKQGPTLPSRDDLVLAREAALEFQAADRDHKRKREKQEDRERVEELVGPKESGREGMMEKKRLKRDNDRSFRDAKDDVLGDYDDSVLMGGGDSFKARIAQRDAAKNRFKEKRASEREENTSGVRERQEAMREKEKSTMEMFKKMAKERFG